MQIFEGGAKGACVVARGTTLQIGSAIGDFVFTRTTRSSTISTASSKSRPASIVLTDLGSRTGVFVRIQGEQELLHGDEILVGRTRLVVDLNVR